MPASLESANIGAIAIGVLLTLLGMSVASVAISIDRAWALRRGIADSRRCASEVHPLLRKGDWTRAQGATAGWQARRAPLAQVMAAGLAEWSAWPPDEDDRALVAARDAAAFAADMSLAEMRRGLTVLATIGSTAPFVGLLGTTFGIIHAFAAIGITGTAAMGAISAGISEALVTTAFGLFVAIPAVWAYNTFLGRLEVLRVELDRGKFVLIEQLARRAS
jgi:biopolymer transport protein ExbB/biopolymer transport protein TolQ